MELRPNSIGVGAKCRQITFSTACCLTTLGFPVRGLTVDATQISGRRLRRDARDTGQAGSARQCLLGVEPCRTARPELDYAAAHRALRIPQYFPVHAPITACLGVNRAPFVIMQVCVCLCKSAKAEKVPFGANSPPTSPRWGSDAVCHWSANNPSNAARRTAVPRAVKAYK